MVGELVLLLVRHPPQRVGGHGQVLVIEVEQDRDEVAPRVLGQRRLHGLLDHVGPASAAMVASRARFAARGP